MSVVGVFARANHPAGYGGFHGKTSWGDDTATGAHGYVLVIVRCKSWDQLCEVRTVIEKPHIVKGERLNEPAMPPGVDPWHRGDNWYAGPYEFVFGIEGSFSDARGMHGALNIGERPSYGDNRAIAYLGALEVLGESETAP